MWGERASRAASQAGGGRARAAIIFHEPTVTSTNSNLDMQISIIERESAEGLGNY